MVTNGEQVDYAELGNLANGIRQTQRLIDTPTSELNTQSFVNEAETLVKRLNESSEHLAKVGIKGTHYK